MGGTKQNIIITGAVIVFAVISLFFALSGAPRGAEVNTSGTINQTSGNQNITQNITGGEEQNRTPSEPEPTYGLMAWANKVGDSLILEFNGRTAILVKFNDTFRAFYSGCVNPDSEPTVFSGKIACSKASGGDGSKWDLYTGALLDGPATEPLDEIPLRIEDNRILGGLD